MNVMATNIQNCILHSILNGVSISAYLERED